MKASRRRAAAALASIGVGGALGLVSIAPAWANGHPYVGPPGPTVGRVDTSPVIVPSGGPGVAAVAAPSGPAPEVLGAVATQTPEVLGALQEQAPVRTLPLTGGDVATLLALGGGAVAAGAVLVRHGRRARKAS